MPSEWVIHLKKISMRTLIVLKNHSKFSQVFWDNSKNVINHGLKSKVKIQGIKVIFGRIRPERTQRSTATSPIISQFPFFLNFRPSQFQLSSTVALPSNGVLTKLTERQKSPRNSISVEKTLLCDHSQWTKNPKKYTSRKCEVSAAIQSEKRETGHFQGYFDWPIS